MEANPEHALDQAIQELTVAIEEGTPPPHVGLIARYNLQIKDQDNKALSTFKSTQGKS